GAGAARRLRCGAITISGSVAFETTLDVPDPTTPLGHERAADAMRLALGISREGYNLFVMGPPGSGKRTMPSRRPMRRRRASRRTREMRLPLFSCWATAPVRPTT
ncbi:MAG: hypothetical protein ACXW2L_19210, partial [Burkholderiales bacterium]